MYTLVGFCVYGRSHSLWSPVITLLIIAHLFHHGSGQLVQLVEFEAVVSPVPPHELSGVHPTPELRDVHCLFRLLPRHHRPRQTYRSTLVVATTHCALAVTMRYTVVATTHYTVAATEVHWSIGAYHIIGINGALHRIQFGHQIDRRGCRIMVMCCRRCECSCFLSAEAVRNKFSKKGSVQGTSASSQHTTGEYRH